MRKFFSCAFIVVVLVGGPPALATNQIMQAWEAKYPTSTLPARMQATTGNTCYLCHHPPSFDLPGNCYREDLSTLIAGGATDAEAIDQLDLVDSDGDGVANGEEATTVREDQPSEVGYNMGLVGPTGTDPCSMNPAEAVTNQLETPPQAIPAASEWGLVVMALLLLVVGTLRLRRVPIRQTV